MTKLDPQILRSRLEGRAFPPMIIVDATNICNLQCIHCPQPKLQSAPNFAARYLQPQIFSQMLSEIASCGLPGLLRFVGDGEPMLHPNMIDMLIQSTRETDWVVNLTTNGTRLNDDAIRKLLNANIHMIDISIDAFSKKTYELIRRGGSYINLLKNIMNLLALRESTASTTKILVSFVLQNENEHEVEAFESFWKPLVDFVSIRALHSANHLGKASESANRSAVSKISRFPCPQLWKRVVIDFEGRIKYCPTDWTTASVIGAVDNGGIVEAWSRIEKLRDQHRKGCIPSESLCGKCIDWASTPWDRGYERIVDSVVYKDGVLAPGIPLLDEALTN